MAVMAPLLIGSPLCADRDTASMKIESQLNANTHGNEAQWEQFHSDLKKLKQKGVTTLSVDVWWGLVQQQSSDCFDWSYYDRLAQILSEEKMRWSPLLSTHACGANVGDDCYVPIPEWVWALAPDMFYVSEAGNANKDCVAHFADEIIFPYIKRFWKEFSLRYLETNVQNNVQWPEVSEIGLSLGPSGELHYPAYHAHDAQELKARYPHRGLFQGCGKRAYNEWQRKMEGGFSQELIDNISDRIDRREYLEQGPFQNLMAHYHESLLEHLYRTLEEAYEVFSSHYVLAIKIPGVHWDSSRQAELMNGLINPKDHTHTWMNVDLGLGYAPIFATLVDLRHEKPDMKLKVYITAAATADAEMPFSRAETLVKAFAALSQQTQISLGLENALAGDLYNAAALSVLESHLGEGRAESVTVLRFDDVLRSEVLDSKRCRKLLGASFAKRES